MYEVLAEMNQIDSKILNENHLPEFKTNKSICGKKEGMLDFSYVEDSNNFQPESLTDENKNEYISRTIEWVFYRSIKYQFESFKEGKIMMKLCQLLIYALIKHMRYEFEVIKEFYDPNCSRKCLHENYY